MSGIQTRPGTNDSSLFCDAEDLAGVALKVRGC